MMASSVHGIAHTDVARCHRHETGDSGAGHGNGLSRDRLVKKDLGPHAGHDDALGHGFARQKERDFRHRHLVVVADQPRHGDRLIDPEVDIACVADDVADLDLALADRIGRAFVGRVEVGYGELRCEGTGHQNEDASAHPLIEDDPVAAGAATCRLERGHDATRVVAGRDLDRDVDNERNHCPARAARGCCGHLHGGRAGCSVIQDPTSVGFWFAGSRPKPPPEVSTASVAYICNDSGADE